MPFYSDSDQEIQMEQIDPDNMDSYYHQIKIRAVSLYLLNILLLILATVLFIFLMMRIYADAFSSSSSSSSSFL